MTVEIYSASVCPFAHRTRLTLLEKGVEFNLTEIDLEKKTRLVCRSLTLSKSARD